MLQKGTFDYAVDLPKTLALVRWEQKGREKELTCRVKPVLDERGMRIGIESILRFDLDNMGGSDLTETAD